MSLHTSLRLQKLHCQSRDCRAVLLIEIFKIFHQWRWRRCSVRISCILYIDFKIGGHYLLFWLQPDVNKRHISLHSDYNQVTPSSRCHWLRCWAQLTIDHIFFSDLVFPTDSTQSSPQPSTPAWRPRSSRWACHVMARVESSAANRLISEVVQSRRRPLLGPSPGWKRLLALSHLRHY